MLSKKNRASRADLLARIPPAATRILVATIKGEQKYKAIPDLADTDEIQVNKLGDPIVMKGPPGRKNLVDTSGPANRMVAATLTRKQGSMATDPVLVKTKQDPDSTDVLHEVIIGLSEEAASLRFERDEAAREGKDSSGFSAKRVSALRAVGDTWLKRMDQIAGKVIDLDSQGFQALFKFMMETLREAMNAAKLQPEQVETIFSKYAALVNEDWKAEAKNRMKSVL